MNDGRIEFIVRTVVMVFNGDGAAVVDH
jgi:hypothetical protein